MPLDQPFSIDYRRLSMKDANPRPRPGFDRAQATEWATWFQALGNPTRVLLLNVLAGRDRPLTVGELTDAVDVGQSTVSHHLAKLADVGFVTVDRVATSSLWQVNRRCIEAFPSAAEMVMGKVPIEFTTAMECADD